MSSLQEHLATLSQAVPALPGKIEAVAHEADVLDQAAQAAVGEFHQRREQASQLVDQLRNALEGLRSHAAEERQHVEQAVHALQDATVQESHQLEDGAQQLQAGGAEVGSAFSALQAALGHAGEQTRAAHEEAHAALHALADGTRSRRSELDGAVHDLTAAIHSTQQAVQEGEASVAEGVSALRERMGRLLQEATQRLEQTRSRLDDLHGQQEAAVAEALKELETQTEHVETELTTRVDNDLEQPLDHELASLAGALGATGQQVRNLHDDCSSRREELEQQVASVADRIPPLQGGVEKVKSAAEQAGVPWP